MKINISPASRFERRAVFMCHRGRKQWSSKQAHYPRGTVSGHAHLKSIKCIPHGKYDAARAHHNNNGQAFGERRRRRRRSLCAYAITQARLLKHIPCPHLFRLYDLGLMSSWACSTAVERGLSIYVFAAHYHAKLPFVASACVSSAYLSPCRV